MTLSQLRNKFKTFLADVYPEEEILSLFHLMAGHLLGYSRFEVTQKLLEPVDEKELTQFLQALERLRQLEPIQYVIGETEFYSLPMLVTPATLIPRPETEELVAWVIEDAPAAVTPVQQILDIGTGSGCIAIALASHMEDSQVSALDFSAEALHVARKNAVRNGVTIDFFLEDITKATSLPQLYDVIVSNPPYVRESEKQQMHSNVLHNEPATALFVSDEDPLLFYRCIARLAFQHLNEGGTLYFEINEYFSEEMQTLVAAEGFSSVVLKKDIFGKFRMLRCRKE